MAASSALRRAIRRIAEAIHGFVKEKGWNPHGYRLFYRANEDWGHIHLIFIAPEFAGGDYYADYAAVTSYLKQDLKDEPGLFDALGVVLMDEQQFKSGGYYELGPEYVDFQDEFTDYWALSSSH